MCSVCRSSPRVPRHGRPSPPRSGPPVSPVSEAQATLRDRIERYASGVPEGEESAARAAFVELKAALNAGTVRAAERDADGIWHTNTWVKAGILLGFRLGRLAPAA